MWRCTIKNEMGDAYALAMQMHKPPQSETQK